MTMRRRVPDTMVLRVLMGMSVSMEVMLGIMGIGGVKMGICMDRGVMMGIMIGMRLVVIPFLHNRVHRCVRCRHREMNW